MSEERLIIWLKISICIGICLLLLGAYLHIFNDYIASLGVSGIVISATCVALGLVFSLPTKMYLTIILMKQEAESHQKN